ncbi:hypothetical protein SERLADRAFT_437321 [Serpula lacrymans var. lacrymans S7.9]|uniref:N-acetyltransferase domain-containing protein n=1 Tax=Serpula lacrymans var. lacrymans (strain S7.9) TaxID=578457 RepID=F8NTB9_SERL9|nr:uncharacterized protein SERLADRAFT_437321 [Serpula lacrymans var. lacrymans S7.9]EGO25591.1 hypothetical protein SERLADRAFT_437321 [Serpula lacrymans var. lacrymans S7.9]
MSATSPYTIRHLAKGEDVEPVISVLNEAFSQDKFSNLISYHDNEVLGQIQRSQVVAASIAGDIYAAEDINKTVVGAAVWFEPGRTLFDSDDQRASALLPMMTKFSPQLQKWWKEEARESAMLDSWHLQSIGVIPEHQGKSIAKALIQEVQAKVSHQSSP